MNKEERQLLLEKLMADEIKKMRKVVKKYNREPLLYTPVEIKESSELEENVAGRITKNENEDKWQIEIDSRIIDLYYKETGDSWINKYNKKNLKGVIGHELTHAWIGENYNNFIEDSDRDSSIIFLNALLMFGYTSGHKCWFRWRWNSNNVVKCANKKEFDRYVISIYKKFNLLEKAYSYNYINKNKIEDYKVKLQFPYNYNINGLERLACVESHAIGYKDGVKTKYDSKSITLSVGAMVDLDKLDVYIERAIEADANTYRLYNYSNYTYKGMKIVREVNEENKVA